MTKHTSRKAAAAAAKRNGTLRSALSSLAMGAGLFAGAVYLLRREHRDAAFTVGRWATPVLLLGVYDLLRKQGAAER